MFRGNSFLKYWIMIAIKPVCQHSILKVNSFEQKQRQDIIIHHQFSRRGGHILLKSESENPKFELSGPIITLLQRCSSILISVSITACLWSLVFFLPAHPWQREGLSTPIQAEYPNSVSAAFESPGNIVNSAYGLSSYCPHGPESLWLAYNISTCSLCCDAESSLPLGNTGLFTPLLLSDTLI